MHDVSSCHCAPKLSVRMRWKCVHASNSGSNRCVKHYCVPPPTVAIETLNISCQNSHNRGMERKKKNEQFNDYEHIKSTANLRINLRIDLRLISVCEARRLAHLAYLLDPQAY